jgi:predicted AAA+ superfamily ATPase
MLKRSRHLEAVLSTLKENPVCALLGPRQCGKTTLARQVAADRQAVFFDLETASARTRLANPELALSGLEGLVIIDEIQRLPELFTALRPIVDRSDRRAQFLILGSAAPQTVRGASESLAGRVGFVDLGGFDLQETGPENLRALWLRGGFPRSYLAMSDAASLRWRRNFIRTFLERDLPQLDMGIPTEALRRFWMMVAHYHGQIWSGAELARSLGVSERNVRGYLDLLSGAFVLRQLQPWFENISKRQYRVPKVYVRDSGLLHALLGIRGAEDLASHPKLGASWEGFALEQVLALAAAGPGEAFCWGTYAGAELDLLLMLGGKRYGIEFKYADAPQMTKSLHIAFEDLKLECAWIAYPGPERYRVHEQVEVVPLPALLDEVAGLSGTD